MEKLKAREASIDLLQGRLTQALALLHAAEWERNAAQERERIAREAYEQQQQSYRELEALYTAMTERAQKAENVLKALRVSRHEEHDDWYDDIVISYSFDADALEQVYALLSS